MLGHHRVGGVDGGDAADADFGELAVGVGGAGELGGHRVVGLDGHVHGATLALVVDGGEGDGRAAVRVDAHAAEQRLAHLGRVLEALGRRLAQRPLDHRHECAAERAVVVVAQVRRFLADLLEHHTRDHGGGEGRPTGDLYEGVPIA
ncbi:MAG: hypothetical protein RIT45_2984 [Pseudomonadota bacterium]|jgi:hypothetical protein